MARNSRHRKETELDSRLGNRVESRHFAHIWWLLILLGVFVQVSDVLSSNYLPKTVWSAVFLALAFLFTRRGSDRPFGLTPLGAIWLAFGLWGLASAIWAPSPRVTVERWIALFFFPSMAYLVAQRTRFWESETFWTAYCVLFSVVCLIGCLQFILPIECLKPWFPKQDFLGWIESTGLPSSTLGNRNYAGEYLAATFPLVLWRFLKADGRAMVVPFVALGLGAAFLLFTRTRSAWLALALAFALIAAFGGARRALRRKRSLPILVATACVVLAAGLVVRPSSRVKTQGRGDGYGGMPVYKDTLLQSFRSTLSDLKTNKRLAMWRLALSVGTNPLLGCGWGNYPIVATPYNPEDKIFTLNYEIHSDVLQCYVDLGVVGLGIVLAFAVHLATLVYRQRQDESLILASGAAVFALTLMLSVTFLSEKVSTQIWTAGIIAVINDRNARHPWKRFDLNRWARGALRFTAVVGLAALAVAAGMTVWGDFQFWKETVRNPRIGLSPDYDRLARDVLPWMQFEPNVIHILTNQTSSTALRAGRLDATETFARKAVSLHSNDAVALGNLVAVALKRSDLETAARYLEEIVRLGPRFATFDVWRMLANCYARLGKEDRAKECLDKALSLLARDRPAAGRAP
ncbi:O-antigen ligase family protein [Candidatus Sumerlaeota bacterium]|nr:O-antigen ligase family protein [Candidatus Sumerlaeota bacterium]